MKIPSHKRQVLTDPARRSTLSSFITRYSAYTLIEMLIYMSIFVLVLGVAYAAMFRGMDNSIALRRNANDIERALEAGERWRADVREATSQVEIETTPDAQILRVPTARGEIAYRFTENILSRRLGEGPWTTMLQDVKSSTMSLERRQKVSACRWELELQTHRKKLSKTRPLFTFIAVPAGNQRNENSTPK